MAEEIDFENGRISNFQRHMTITLTLDQVIWHTVVHHLSTSTYVPNFIRIGNFLWTDGQTYEWMDGQTSRSALLDRLGGVNLINKQKIPVNSYRNVIFWITYLCQLIYSITASVQNINHQHMRALCCAHHFVNGCINWSVGAMLCCHNLLFWHDVKWCHRQSEKTIKLKK